MEIIETMSCWECGMILGKYNPRRFTEKQKMREKLERHNELHHSGKYKQDAKGNWHKITDV